MNPKHFSSCLLAILSYFCLVDGLQPDRFAELLSRGANQPGPLDNYERLSAALPTSIEDVEKLKTDLTVLAKLHKDGDNGVYDTRLDSDSFAEPADEIFLLESKIPPSPRKYEQLSVSKMDDWNTILNELLPDNDDTGGESQYFGPLDEDITPISYNELLQYPLYDNEYKPAKYRRKRSFCDRYGNCGKRSGGKSVSKQHDQSNSIINHNGHSDDAFNENLGRGDETDLTEFYTSNEVLPTLKTFLGRKHVSKKHSPLMSVVKRSLNRSSDQKDKEFETTATKLNEKVYEKIRQYCLTHVCKIKPNIKPNRSNFKTTENDLTGTGNNGVKLDVMSRLKALLKERSRARNDVIDGNKHLNAKRANPFCPPWGCGRRRRKVSVSLDGLKEELRDLLGTRFTRLRYRKIRPKSVESSAPGEWTFERKQRLSLFCPYGGCRGRQ